MKTLRDQVDHIVYATPDLNFGIEQLEKLLGITATPGGRHPGWGTHNALISLGPDSYLEIIGPDPESPGPEQPRPFQIDSLSAPRLVTWVAKGSQLAHFVSQAKQQGIILGEVMAMSRRTPGGELLSWQLTNPRVIVADGIIPAFIDWGDTRHPAPAAAGGALLVSLRAEHPEAAGAAASLDSLGLKLPVAPGTRPGLIATIDCPQGRVEL
ncbi:VOC family protein [Sporomusa termitida]|uniref:Glyoxalase-like domain protein n=1 Tax=Sporomusa termitida TaxID=2377 RepID=A0A517DWY7_9FIRM|nr:VOC family protein [Sporomusa termitida]QDR81870.1 Glyoxalase-like domain protein [Sporomusa termitida]